MRQSHQRNARTLLWPALALAVSALALPVQAQTGGTTGSGTSAREVQRGVPGVDVDVGTRADGRPRSNGVPGVDVDVRTGQRNNDGVRGVDVNTRASGAAGGVASNDRRARADRN